MPENSDAGWSIYSNCGYVISHLVGILVYNLHIIYMYSAAQSPYVDRTSTHVDARRRTSTHVDAKNFDVYVDVRYVNGP